MMSVISFMAFEEAKKVEDDKVNGRYQIFKRKNIFKFEQIHNENFIAKEFDHDVFICLIQSRVKAVAAFKDFAITFLR